MSGSVLIVFACRAQRLSGQCCCKFCISCRGLGASTPRSPDARTRACDVTAASATAGVQRPRTCGLQTFLFLWEGLLLLQLLLDPTRLLPLADLCETCSKIGKNMLLLCTISTPGNDARKANTRPHNFYIQSCGPLPFSCSSRGPSVPTCAHSALGGTSLDRKTVSEIVSSEAFRFLDTLVVNYDFSPILPA